MNIVRSMQNVTNNCCVVSSIFLFLKGENCITLEHRNHQS